MNKNTLAALKEELGEYWNALPIFEMKEQQLNGIVLSIENGISVLQKDIDKTNEDIKSWAAVMAEDGVDLDKLVIVDQVNIGQQEIAGVTVESFVDIKFSKDEVDYFMDPLWTDAASRHIAEQKTKHVMLEIEVRNLG